MDLSLLGLREQPFSQPVLPNGVFEHPEASEIRARICEVVEHRGGLVTLTGEPGIGKTTVLQWALSTVSPPNRVVFLPVPVAGEDLLRRVAGALGLSASGGEGAPVTLKVVRSALAAERDTGGCVVVAIDQAHRVTDETLIILGLLMAPARDLGPLMPVILVAQPELERQLARLRRAGAVLPAAVSCRLGPLSAAQVRAYIDEHVRRAGGDPMRLFETDVVHQVVAHTRGIPRLIDTICAESLRAAATAGRPRISGALVDRVARRFEPSETAPAGAMARGRARVRAWRPPVARAREALSVWRLPVARARKTLSAWRLPVARAREALSAWRLPHRDVKRRVSAVVAVAGAVVVLTPLGILFLHFNERSRPPTTADPIVAIHVPALTVRPPEGPSPVQQSAPLQEGGPSSEPTASPEPLPSEGVDRPAARPSPPTGTGPSEPERSPPGRSEAGSRRLPAREGRSAVREPTAEAWERALLEAAEQGNLPTLQALLRAAVSPGARDPDGLTPLMLAAIHGHGEVARALIDHGARVNDRSARGLSALMLAIMNRHGGIVRLLCGRGADVNARDHLGWTPLMHAAWIGDPEAVRLLLQRGADRRAADHRGWTAGRYARWRLAHPATGVDEPAAHRDLSAEPDGQPIPSRAPHAEVTALLNAPSPGLPASPRRAARTPRQAEPR